MNQMKDLKDYITTIPDFPEKGILFRDVTTMIQDPAGFRMAINGLIDMLKGIEFDLVLGSESRGFVFGAPVAYALNKGLVLVRKKGKLPRNTILEEYELEYGKASLEVHSDCIVKDQRVVIIDDLLATGGTTGAVIKLAEKLGGNVVKICFVIELAGLNGRSKLNGIPTESLIVYDGK